MKPDRKFWSGKTVLLTGHTGFKGAWLSLWLNRLGAKVVGLSLPPVTAPNLFDLLGLAQNTDSHFLDIRQAEKLKVAIKSAKPDVVFHLAAQALVRESYNDALATFETNVGGTANLLEALRHSPSVKAAVIVTTDKVYRNAELAAPFMESDPLGGHDPYSASKAAAEIVVESYRESFLRSQGLAIATARAGNVIGGGDWSAERLLPDCMKAWAVGETVEIRMPGAMRPWQHVLDPLAGYMILAEKLWADPTLASSYNFGPDAEGAATVREAVSLARDNWGQAKVNFWEINTGPKEAQFLRLSNAKARSQLGVKPVWPLKAAMSRSVRWYKDFTTTSASELCFRDIEAFEQGKE